MPKSFYSVCGLFIAILLYFVFSNGWYGKDQLMIKGHTEIGAVIEIQWDSGSGYNGYEKKKFTLNTSALKNDKIPIIIRYLGEKNPASLSRNIVCSRISVDNNDVNLSELISEPATYKTGTGISLNESFRELYLLIDAKSFIEIELLTNNYSGKVEISVGTKTITKDLYIANNAAKTGLFQYWIVDELGNFEILFDLPRYASLTYILKNVNRHATAIIESVALQDGDGLHGIDIKNLPDSNSIHFKLSEVRKKNYFDSVQWSFQICFALISTWLIVSIWRKTQYCGGLSNIFTGKRKIFWILTAGAVISYGVWLVAFWPGVMSVDSMKIWRAAILPEVFVNDHPILNVILYMYLSHIWQNPAVVPIFHISMMAILTGHIFYQIHKQGVKLNHLLPFYFILICSVPVGLYNIVLWKDIPFAMLVVFWAFSVAQFYREKIDGVFDLSVQKIIVFILLLFCLAFTRHNGVIYLLVIPLLCVIVGVVTIRKFSFAAALLVLVCGLTVTVLKMGGVLSDFDYLFVHAGSYLTYIADTSFVKIATRIFEDYQGILNINQTDTKWDLWHYYLADRKAYSFLVHAQWNDVFNYIAAPNDYLNGLREFCLALYWKSYEVPWVYLTWNPLYVLFILPVSVLFYRITPLTAIFSSVILSQVGALLLIDVLNWRYYYFVCLGGLFLGPLLLLDLQRRGIGRLKTS